MHHFVSIACQAQTVRPSFLSDVSTQARSNAAAGVRRGPTG